jgi:hypothetical protein
MNDLSGEKIESTKTSNGNQALHVFSDSVMDSTLKFNPNPMHKIDTGMQMC